MCQTLLRISCGISSMKMIAAGAFRSCEMTWRRITCSLINLYIWIAFHSQCSFMLSSRALTNERQDFLAVLGLRWKWATLHVACNMWCLYWKNIFFTGSIQSVRLCSELEFACMHLLSKVLSSVRAWYSCRYSEFFRLGSVEMICKTAGTFNALYCAVCLNEKSPWVAQYITLIFFFVWTSAFCQ